jgi:hypothetical protein
VGGVLSVAGLRVFLYVFAAVAVVAGTATVILGSESIPSAGDPNANLESELRFYSVWWIGAGLFLAWLAPRVEEQTRALRAFCALLFLAATARLLAVLETDWPSTGQIVLMGAEFALALILVAWQARAARQEQRMSVG